MSAITPTRRRFRPDELRYPDALPITARRRELVEAIRANQVLIVEGETGSGKSTQLPKLCLEAGRGVDGLIGHTQPRRVAARTIAERVAEELGTPLGTDVGYTVRFTDTVAAGAAVKVMTDGILLAEIQRDRMLSSYDTLIVDEAHERSLNIDFILGYLRELLPQRPDLKLIVTSATIDTERFAGHFAGADGEPAPVLSVSGRTYPVEVRYRPYGEDDDRDQVQAILDAVDELGREGPGDVLVFLSGEREIHDAADALRRSDDPHLEVLPLYARLSAPEQHRIFEPHRGRRVVLSTNVAETSLTVPGVRYVVDTGTARVSRYSKRLKVQRLPIEPVSQASADQRAGRCGRVAPGICIRLYSEDDFESRPEFTEPEILRTNLASVILQMTAIGLGDVDRFPFVEAPDAASVRDGYLLLEELAAIEPETRTRRSRRGGRRLTASGRRLARLPVDPRLGRMILESERLHCTREVLVIAAALSIRDVRERPTEHRARADQLHARFAVEGSDLLSIVSLWDHLRSRQRELSGNRFRKLCRDEYLNYLRVREWVDLYSQLRRVAGSLGMRPASTPAHPDNVHRAVLAGHLSHIGRRDRASRDYVGARQARFVIAPGSVLSKRPPEWVMAAELVETHRLQARRVATIQPEWAERLGEHLVKRSHGDPRWDRRAARAVTTERVTLYGVPLVTDRVVGYDRVDPAVARAWFISKALVEGEWDPSPAVRDGFVARNDAFVGRMSAMTARVRRAELLDDEQLFAFYDDRVADGVCSAHDFERWWRDAGRRRPHLLDLDERALRGVDELLDLTGYPDMWRQGDIELPLTYRFAPGEPLDGVTVHIPLDALNQVRDEGFDWQIPGYRRELVDALVRSLPKALRRQMIPLADTIEDVWERLPHEPAGRLRDVLATTLRDVTGVAVRPDAVAAEAIPDELRVHFVVSGPDGEVHDVGTDLTAIKRRLIDQARRSIAASAPIEERRGITTWDLGDLPQVVEVAGDGLGVRAYPTLLDVGDSVALRVVSSDDLQRRAMRGGVRRLLVLEAAPTRSATERLITGPGQLALAGADIPLGVLVDDCILAAVDASMEGSSLPWTRADYEVLRDRVRGESPRLTRVALTKAVSIVVAASRVRDRLARLRAPALAETVADANGHLGRLVRPGFVTAAGLSRLDDVERYVRGIEYRLDHLGGAVARDVARIEDVAALESRYARTIDALGAGEITPELAAVRWQLEELRVATFAQPVGARGSVSAARIARTLDA